MYKVLSIFGTRPEAIKMAPLIQILEKEKSLQSLVCVTAQHREMLDQVLNLFNIKTDYDLDIMQPDQSLTESTSAMIKALEPVLMDCKPDLVLVHGDTTTALCGALASFYQQIPVGHLESGLRTYNPYSAWPEEINRQLTDVITKLHFSPTESSARNLYNECKNPNDVFVTGNTIVDALMSVRKKLEDDVELVRKIANELPTLDFSKRRVLITGHRRENFSEFESICTAIKQLAKQYPDYEFVYPVHLNPNVKKPVYQLLDNQENVKLIAPQDYFNFIYLMSTSYIVMTDSCGIQEEAPFFGVPVIVMRETTERVESLNAGTITLAGTKTDTIVKEVNKLIKNPAIYKKMSRTHNAYGDGKASERIVKIIKEFSNRPDSQIFNNNANYKSGFTGSLFITKIKLYARILQIVRALLSKLRIRP